MQFSSRANRKLIAGLMFSVMYLDLYASVHTKSGAEQPLPVNTRYDSYTSMPVSNRTLPVNEPLPTAASNKIASSLLNKKQAPPVMTMPASIEEAIARPVIDGPGQPESKGFRPAGLDNMVDLFSGDFSYNIPLLDVGGYPINIFYNGNISMEQEASWVGLGWNINPGSISRNMRGLPDDFSGENGDVVKKEMNLKTDLTVGVNLEAVSENFGYPVKPKFEFTGRKNLGVFYNNYRGVGVEVGWDPTININRHTSTEYTGLDLNTGEQVTAIFTQDAGSQTAGLNMNLNSQNGLSLSPHYYYSKLEKAVTYGANLSMNYNSRAGLQAIQMGFSENRQYKDPTLNYLRSYMPGLAAEISFARPAVTPSIRMPMNTFNANLSLRIGKNYSQFKLKKSTTIKGYLSQTKLKSHEKISKAYGYFHFTKATDEDALMDFNRINDIPYQEVNPVMAFPVYTYDVFTISGEGTGGSFRGYRSDIGYVKDQAVKTTSSAFGFGLGLNKGTKPQEFKIDIDLNLVYSPTEAGAWKQNNFAKNALPFTSDKDQYQSVYFKNPAEKTIIDKSYFDALGGDEMVRLKMVKLPTAARLQPQLEKFNPETKYQTGELPVSPATLRIPRDKRSQVITTLTAQEAEVAGLTPKIEYYPVNAYPKGDCDPIKKTIERWDKGVKAEDRIRKPGHIGEVRVLGGDGKTYVYSVPAYTIKQTDVSFAAEGRTVYASEGLIKYEPGEDNDVEGDEEDPNGGNKRGHDHFYQRETIPSYAHSFLLSGLLSPDYVDVKGDGITEDDLGNAVKFNYSRVSFGEEEKKFTSWRVPFTANSADRKANYSPGMLTDKFDDKANYSYGEKEMWYLNSIESKTMIATFEIGPRDDSKSPAGEDGGVSETEGAYKLVAIKVYSKAKFKTLGTAAVPIKTVRFSYDYSLCPGTPTNETPGGGKLTLKRIWFEYEDNTQRTYKNPYVFKYGNNKSYDRMGNDRWGNYKNAAYNTGDVPNDQFSYVAQNPADLNNEVAPWQLNEVVLPSGGKIKVTYEADDYGFVQNKRAAAMMKIEGFGSNSSGTYNDKLYNVSGPTSFKDNFYVYVKAAQTLHATEATAKMQIRDRYLADITQLYLKLYVLVPRDQYNPAGVEYEPIGLYADIMDFGPAPNRDYFWIKVAGPKDNISQVMDAVLQYGKDNLPSKVYPGYNTRHQSAVQAAVRTLLGMGLEIVRTVGGFDNVVRHENKFRQVDLSKSIVRLSHPAAKKRGGGYRVKELKMQDSWNAMTGQFDSEMGQVYEYTTKMKIAGEDKVISSGVASYEPMIGGEENPFRGVLRSRVNRILMRDQYLMQETPVGEMFYPAASVGYSLVRVSSIKRENVKNGTTVQETGFFTTKDFPTVSVYTTFDPQSKIKYRPNPILKLMTHRSIRSDNLSQGLLISLNDMNGKMRFQAVYPGNDLEHPITYTENFYKSDKISESKVKLNNLVPVVKKTDGVIHSDQLVGKDIEMMVDFREHVSKTYTAGLVDFNLDVNNIMPPVFFVLFLKGLYYDESMYRASSVVKIVNTYGILDSVVVIDKGSVVGTKNMVYDGETGEVLVNRTNNEFDKPIFSFNYPAYWAYNGMSGAYKNINTVFKGIDMWEGLVTGGNMNMDFLQSGDELMIVDQSIITTPKKSTGCLLLEGPAGSIRPGKERIIWAIDAMKDGDNEGHRRFIFVDRNGKLINGTNMTLKIVRSGYRNILAASVGSITSLKDPKRLVSSQNKLVFDNLTDVVNAGVQEFRENWRTDTLYEQKSTIQQFTDPGTFSYHSLVPQNVVSLWGKYDNNILKGEKNFPTGDFLFRTPQFKASFFSSNAGSNKNTAEAEKSWMLFDITSLPSGGYITRAQLDLGAKPYTGNLLPHFSAEPLNNTLYLQRTKYAWQGSSPGDLNNWKQYFLNWRTPGTTVLHPSTLLTDNWLEYGPGHRDAFINVTNLAREMHFDKLAGKPYATAFKLSLRDNQLYWEGKRNKTDAIPKNWAAFKHLAYDCPGGAPLRTNASVPSNTSVVCPALNVTCLTCPPTYHPDSVFNFKTGYTYFCSKMDVAKYCESIFNRDYVNPYTSGLLGRWQAWRSLVYYGKRVESEVATDVNLGKGGVIDNFTPYWTFNTTGLTTTSPSVWVWNIQKTQVNTKGAELENKDPLGRYNAGVYGYNDNLPIAIANNAKYQEVAFDGFEDYEFSTQDCIVDCKRPRRVSFNDGGTIVLDNNVSHSGLSSLKVNASSEVQLNGIVRPKEQTDDYDVQVQVDSTSITQTVVNGLGAGFRGVYYSNNNYTGQILDVIDAQIAFNWLKNDVSERKRARSIKWDGYVQAPESGSYRFVMRCSEEFKVTVDGVAYNVPNPLHQVLTKVIPQTFVQGNTYHIEIEYKQITLSLIKTDETVQFYWEKLVGGIWQPSSIPGNLVYAPGTQSNAPSAITSTTFWCHKINEIGGEGNFLNDGFNLIRERKMWISAWMKEGGQDCKCSTYNNVSIKVYIDGVAVTGNMKPSGSIIDGWQRMEGEFTVPSNANTFSIRFQNGGGNQGYFDDIRIQPFNSNMKSFVYNPSNLRLMAELDDNNYATFYEYDDEGQLVRVKKETAKGIKTISESRTSIQKKIEN